mmetsp:Transcript_34355/g.86881  ORF Transcript_34355/g.86881 Transcript_34355/m.86881 type:complete len:236 (-) Transcript_34355:113-820(-)
MRRLLGVFCVPASWPSWPAAWPSAPAAPSFDPSLRFWPSLPPGAAELVTATLTRTGLRRPARANACTASVCVAENRPVRRWRGRRAMMASSCARNPMSSSRSASSSTSTSSLRASSADAARPMTSRMRPGVPTSTCAPCSRTRAVSSPASVPPTSSCAVTFWRVARKGAATLWICLASSLVGDTMIAPTWCLRRGSSSCLSFSTMGITKARVLPEPVHASTATSLCPQNRGITAS